MIVNFILVSMDILLRPVKNQERGLSLFVLIAYGTFRIRQQLHLKPQKSLEALSALIGVD